MSDNVTRLRLGDREFVLLGTAHVSQESVQEVTDLVRSENPDRVCVEIDEGRFQSLTQRERWSKLDVAQILREGKGFLLMAQLALASFQRRLGVDLGTRPGEEMLAAIRTAAELDIPCSLCDREVQVTLRRAWARTGFWGKNKMLAALLASAFTNEKLEAEDIERLKEKNALESMMEEMAEFLPSVKEVLIDERDLFLATRVYQAAGSHVVAVVGAGHVPGMVKRLKALHDGEPPADLTELERIPPKTLVARVLPWVLPVAIVGALIAGFFLRGSDVTVTNLLRWTVINGGLAAIGALIALAHPLTVAVSALAAPLTSLIPVIGVGIPAGILEAALKRPRVGDFETLNGDLTTTRGFYRNRITHVLVVFFLSSLGSVAGTFLGGVPIFASLFGG
jgi:pheromone shutdown-related protein TraB